jgi:hypothetical protein
LKGGFKVDKNNKKNDQPIDIDNLRLKDHLNTSFDIDKLVVSEDLINKTLKAIKESENKPDLINEIKRKQAFPVRRYAYAAAAIMVLFVGVYAFENNTNKNPNAEMRSLKLEANQALNTSDENAVSDSKMETYIADANSSAANSSMTESNAADSNTAGNNSQDSETQAGIEDNGKSDSTEMATLIAPEENTTNDVSTAEGTGQIDENSTEGMGDKSLAVANATMFSSLFPVTYDTPETFTITNIDGNSAVLNDSGSTTRKFYEILDAYSITEVNSDIGNEWTYKTQIKAAENQNYTFLFGDLIQVTTMDKDGNLSTQTFETQNMSSMMLKLDDFFGSLHK